MDVIDAYGIRNGDSGGAFDGLAAFEGFEVVEGAGGVGF
jgi:hypothetical protein